MMIIINMMDQGRQILYARMDLVIIIARSLAKVV